MTRRCRGCGSTDIHRSTPRGWVELLSFLVMFRPYRCYNCNRRYYGFVFLKKEDDLAITQEPSPK